MEQQTLHLNYDLMRKLSFLQEELRVLAVTSVLQPNFCWKTLTPAARKAHMLEGLLRTCMIEPIYGPHFRMYTCDITLASLETDSGEGFLTLLKKYVPDGAVSIADSSCMSFWHPDWKDEMMTQLKKAGHEVELRMWIAQRDQFLSNFLHNTILSVIGTPRPPEISIMAFGRKSTTVDCDTIPKKPTKKKSEGESPDAAPVYRQAHVCDGCGEPEREGVRFSVCRTCNEKKSRKVFYCSRRCQISHWPNHKPICGKEFTIEAVHDPMLQTEASLAEEVFLLRRVGPTSARYTRSPMESQSTTLV
ncbi:hypothetical protein B0H19DRAFT_1268313 [Mycena capillaripes]|nr:hypothetical protein B0H19DRAFT_1268313 [Mycena capillaripes]